MTQLSNEPPRIEFLYTNIGRGHPFYLDGIIEALVRRGNVGLVRGQSDVFTVSTGASRAAWRLVRKMYHSGASGGLGGLLYSRLRDGADYNQPGYSLRLLSRSIVNEFMGRPWPLVVAHPILVAALKGKKNLIYQHGELAAPREALVHGADKVLAPTEETAQAFIDFGYHPDDVAVTGLCIEPSLVKQAEDAFALRQPRLEEDSEAMLTAAFFSSGAEPKAHVEILAAAVVSHVRAGGRALVFARRGGRLQTVCSERCRSTGIDFLLLDQGDTITGEPPVTIVTFQSRRELNYRTTQFFPQFDLFLAPAHERSNWALGLGLPMFIVGPEIGPYAPLNRDRLLQDEVALPLANLREAEQFGERLLELREIGELSDMAQDGWHGYPIDGFETIAGYFLNHYRTVD